LRHLVQRAAVQIAGPTRYNTAMRVIPDDELERLATERGSKSYQAGMLAELRERRAKDEQVFCFELGEFLVIGPMVIATLPR
jgi:hypothetical protein